MKKSELRKIYISKRLSLSDKDLMIFQDLLLIQFQKLKLPYIKLIHSYLPLYDKREPDPTPLLDWLRFSQPGVNVCYPKIDISNLGMVHLIQSDKTFFKLNQYGIPEPENGEIADEEHIDLIMVPLLAFDALGNRVGYGKGYYDRFLAKCRKNAVKIGISYFNHTDKIEDLDKFDKKLDFCITPHQIYAF